ENVTHAADCLNVERQFRVFFDLAPEPRHLNVDGAFQRDAQPRAQIGSRERTAGIGGQQLEQSCLSARHSYTLSAPPEFAPPGIEKRGTHLDFAMRLH